MNVKRLQIFLHPAEINLHFSFGLNKLLHVCSLKPAGRQDFICNSLGRDTTGTLILKVQVQPSSCFLLTESSWTSKVWHVDVKHSHVAFRIIVNLSVILLRFRSVSRTYVLSIGSSLLDPGESVQGHIGGSMFPRGSERGLAHLGELQVLGSRNNICSTQRPEHERNIRRTQLRLPSVKISPSSGPVPFHI